MDYKHVGEHRLDAMSAADADFFTNLIASVRKSHASLQSKMFVYGPRSETKGLVTENCMKIGNVGSAGKGYTEVEFIRKHQYHKYASDSYHSLDPYFKQMRVWANQKTGTIISDRTLSLQFEFDDKPAEYADFEKMSVLDACMKQKSHRQKMIQESIDESISDILSKLGLKETRKKCETLKGCLEQLVHTWDDCDIPSTDSLQHFVDNVLELGSTKGSQVILRVPDHVIGL